MKLQGHAAGGFLATRALLHWLKPACASERAGELALGTFAGILPDLDYIYYAIQNPFHSVA